MINLGDRSAFLYWFYIFLNAKIYFMQKFIKISIGILFITISATGQGNIWDLGARYEYNSGKTLSQSGIGLQYDGFKNKSSWNFGITYNLGNTKAKDAKESGIGIFAGYRYGFSFSAHGNLFGGLQLAAEFDNWKDKDGKALSKESVFIPRLEAGYNYVFGNAGHGFAAPGIGYGYGIKINETGTEKKADEGSRVIPFIAVGYRF